MKQLGIKPDETDVLSCSLNGEWGDFFPIVITALSQRELAGLRISLSLEKGFSFFVF